MMEETQSHQFNRSTTGRLTEARALIAQGRGGWAKARAILEGILRESPEEFEPLDLEAELLVDMGEGHLALRLLEEYTRYFPENADARARLAWLHHRLGKKEEAIAEARATMERHPESLAARQWLVEWALEAEDTLTAVREAEAGLERHPDDLRLLTALASAASRRNDEKKAREAYRRLLGMNPGDERLARAYAGFLLDQNHSGEALSVLDPFLSHPDVAGETLLRAADASFRARHEPKAVELLRRFVSSPSTDNETLSREGMNMVHQGMGLTGGDQFLFSALQEGRMADGFAVEFLEASGQRGNRDNLIRLYKVFSADPLRYPRSMARFLSTYYSAPLVPGAVAKWVASNGHSIEQNVTIWGGVGAWYVQRGKWREAIAHLRNCQQRPGVRPWIVLLLCRAQEASGDIAAANDSYRFALELPPDHSEPAIRSRLAFNLALEDMPAAGQIILLDCTDAGKKLTTVEDLLRIFAVESLLAAEGMDSGAACQALFEETIKRMTDLAKSDRNALSAAIIRTFRKKTTEVLMRQQ